MNSSGPLSIKQKLLLLLIPAVISAAVVFWLWRQHPELNYWRDLLLQIRDWLEANPGALVLCLVILPGLGFPISILLVLAGIVFVPEYGLLVACLIAIAAQSLCSLWAYYLSAGPLRSWLIKYLLKDRPLPQPNARDALRLGFIFRITPGIPYALQNIVLGVIGLDLKTYLLVSLPIQSIYTIGFVVTSGSLFQGKSGLAIAGAVFLIVIVLVTRMIRQRKKAIL
ncbi:MAG: TVP38/TMEM64 family protein [Opitutales bacterium]